MLVYENSITPLDILFFLLPIVLGFYFYARAAKAVIERDKVILFGLSLASFLIWMIYVYIYIIKPLNHQLLKTYTY